MVGKLLLDTDVLIDYLRGRSEAVTYLDSLIDVLSISVITVAELYAGVRDGAERATLEVFIRAFLILPVNQEIAIKGGLYRRDFGRSHSVGLADAVIAATVDHHQATLVTLNNKHFPMLTSVVVPYQKS